MFYINQNIPCKKIETFQFITSIEILTLEIKLRKEKLLIFDTNKPPNISNSSFLNELYNAITFYSTLYKNFVLLDGLNIVRENSQLQNLCESFLFEHLIKKPTCYKGDTSTGIDHIITNIPKLLQKVTQKNFAIAATKFNLEQFQMELKEKLDEISNNSFDNLLEEFKTCLDKFSPLKEKKN